MTTMQHNNARFAAEYEHATSVARQICARVFRDGGAPAEALEAFGIAHADIASGWRDAVDRIAHELVHSQSRVTNVIPMRRAA